MALQVMPKPTDNPSTLKIASFAIENDTLFATYLVGSVDHQSGSEFFKYEKIEPVVPYKMGHILDASEFRNAITTALHRFGSPNIDAVAIATYGAVDTISGQFSKTPSDGDFSNPTQFNFRDVLRGVIGDVELVIENDATAAAVGEYHFGVGRKANFLARSTFAYIWISRGVNAGVVLDGYPLGVRFRPETGHMLAGSVKGLKDPIERGSCSAHTRCITGMAGSKTVLSRLSRHALPFNEAIELSADYVAQLCATISLTVAPAQIVLGGRQMTQEWADEVARAVKPSRSTKLLNWGESLLEEVKKRYPLHLQGFPFHQTDGYSNETIVRSRHDILAPLLGVAEIARRRIQPDVQLRR